VEMQRGFAQGFPLLIEVGRHAVLLARLG